MHVAKKRFDPLILVKFKIKDRVADGDLGRAHPRRRFHIAAQPGNESAQLFTLFLYLPGTRDADLFFPEKEGRGKEGEEGGLGFF